MSNNYISTRHYQPKTVCKNNAVCKYSNCDIVTRGRSENYNQNKWIAGVFWGAGNPCCGWYCYHRKFAGCYASKTFSRTVYYNSVRSSTCNTYVTPTIVTGTTGTLTIKA